VGAVGGLLLVPFAYGLASGDSLAELLAGPGLLHMLPVYGRPAVLAIVLLLPLAVVVLLRSLIEAHRDDDRDPVVAWLLLLCALVPLTVGISALLAVGDPGLVLRTYSAHDWDSLHSQRISSEAALRWESPPEGLPDSQFWMEWEGVLQIQQSGKYRFGLFGEGAGGHVYVDGYLVTDGLEESAHLDLDLGSHRIRVGLIAQADSGSFSLRWTTPGEGTFVDIPRALLSHTDSELEWRRSPRQAAQVGLEWLQSNALRWQRYNGCYGCHVQGQALMGLSIGQDSGYLVNEAVLGELEDFVRSTQSKDGSWHDHEQLTATQFAAMGLAWLGRGGTASKDSDLREAVDFLVSKQDASGEFPVDLIEVPIAQGSMMTTSNSLFALSAMDKAHAAEAAFQWILQGHVTTSQDAAMQLMSIARKAPALPLKAERMRSILGTQQVDGGWKETQSTLGSSGFSTGQVLYALKLAGQPVDSPQFGAGVRFLMEHQQISGKWKAMHTRSARRSDYAPTMWAVIGLAGSYDTATPDVVAQLPLDDSVTQPSDSGVRPPLEETKVSAEDVSAPVSVPVSTELDESRAPEPEGLAIEWVYPSAGEVFQGRRTCEVRLHSAPGTPLQLVGLYLGTDRLAEKAVSAQSGWSELQLECDFSGVDPGAYELTAVVQDRAGDRARVQQMITVGEEEPEGED